LEQPSGSRLWVVFGYLVVGLLFAGIYCAWEMLLASAAGRPPSPSRWVMLLVAATLFASGILVEGLLTVPAAFNKQLDTYWGFVLSPWFFLAFIPCAAILVAFRMLDATRADRLGGVPAVVWWCLGCLGTTAYGTALLWVGGRSAAIEHLVVALGLGLAVAAGCTLVAMAVLRRRSQPTGG
jgi:hypothetical protein